MTTGRRDPQRGLGPQKHLGAPGTGGLRLSLTCRLSVAKDRFRLRWVPGPEATKGGQGSRAGQRWQGGSRVSLHAHARACN